MSCSSAARTAPRSAPRPSSSAAPATSAATRCECPPVDGDFASTTSAKACATRLIRASSAGIAAGGGAYACTAAASAAGSRGSRSSRTSATSSGSNQRPRRRRAVATPQISTVCASPAMRASSGISSPRSPSGCPRPSQCSSSERIAATVAGPKPRSAAIAAPRSQRIRTSSSWKPSEVAERPQRAHALPQRPVVGGGGERMAEAAGGAREVAPLGGALDAVVVGDQHRGDARGVARAAHVLEQERVVERGARARRRAPRGGRSPSRSGSARMTWPPCSPSARSSA